MSLAVGKKARLALWGAVAFLFSITAVAYLTTTRLATEGRHIARELRLRTAAEALLETAKDAEIAESGYILSGDRHFLAVFRRAVASFPSRVESVGSLIGSDPGQRAALAKAADLAQGRFQVLSDSLERARRLPAPAPDAALLAKTGQQAIDELSAILNAVVGRETARLESELQTERATIRWSFGGIVLADAIAFVLLVASGTTIRRQILLREHAAKEKEDLLTQLQEALTKVKLLRGLLPVCANCKKIRDGSGNWEQMEAYISSHSEAEFSHGICPDCVKSLYPQFSKDL